MAVPSWKLALQERKKKQEEEEKLKKAKENQQKLASLPAWKRAILMREKGGGPTAVGPADSSSPSSSQQHNGPVKPHPEKWQVAVERVKGPDSPILTKRAPPSSVQKSTPSTTTSTSAPDDKRSQVQKTVLSRWAPGSGTSEAASPKVARASPVVKRAATFSSSSSGSSKQTPLSTSSPVNKRSTGTTHTSSPINKRPPSSSNNTGSSVKKLNAASKWSSQPAPSASKSTSTSQAAKEDEDPALMSLPPWKRALILKKRKSQQNLLEVESKPAVGGEDETDSGSVIPVATNNVKSDGKATSEIGSSTVVLKQPVPEIVNRQTKSSVTDQRLVQQEGKTLHPPIFKEVDQWANVAEEDDKFLSLPPWKQALIKRRRADIANRSGQPVTVTPTPPKEPTPTQTKVPAAGKVSTGSPNNTTNKSPKKTAGSTAKSVKKQSGTKGMENKRNKTNSVASTKKSNEQNATGKKRPGSGQKPVRKAPAIPAAKKEEEPEPMFSYSFSHRSLDTGGGSSSDSTDSDLEDAVVTNLDGDSDESDSGIVLQSYSKSSSDIKNNEPKRSSSILSLPGKKKAKKLRRVSWSDSQLVSEHFYPKYDYSDYEEVKQTKASQESSEFSHRLHPSLLPPSDGDPYTSGFNPPGYSQGGSLSNFVPSSLSPSVMEGNYEFSFQEVEENEASSPAPNDGPAEHDYSDYYSDQTSNAAALLW